MIELGLTDGRILLFARGASNADGPAPLQVSENNVDMVKADNFDRSTRQRRGPDFLSIDPSEPNTLLAVELKTETNAAKAASSPDRMALIRNSIPAKEGQTIIFQLWFLSKDGRNLNTWTLSPDEKLKEHKSFHLVEIRSPTPPRQDAVIARSEAISTSDLKRRVTDWEDRIRHLYRNIERWLRQLEPDLSTQQTGSVEMNEELMKLYAVEPRKLPVLSIRRDSKVLLTFKPYGLWVIGANGRIDIVSPGDTYFLVDRSVSFAAPQWQLFGSSAKKIGGRSLSSGVDFSERALGELLHA